MDRLLRLMLAICAPLILTGCLVTPGKFVSTLDIRADRSFTFTYQGEVLALNTDEMENMDKGAGDEDTPGDERKASLFTRAAAAKAIPKSAPKSAPKTEAGLPEKNAAKMREIAEALSKEHGYQSVKYVGNNVFMIDYRISGRLDHGFIYPFNLDASMIVPFIAVELRGTDRVRVKAPGYANGSASGSSMGMPSLPGAGGNDADKAAQRLDGRFTLTTDAEIVSQNQEDGTAMVPGGKAMSWKITPQTSAPPMAVLKLKPLP